MASPMTADQLLAALRKWHVPFEEYPGWRTRTRPGGLTDVVGVGVHHTGSDSQSDDYLNFLFVRGRPEDGIPGPLCNVATDAAGVLHLGAIGRANHFGSGSQSTLDHVRNEDYAGFRGELAPGPDGINGNPRYYGNEIMYSGGHAPTAAAYRTALLYAAAVCDFHGWSALSVIAHREHTRRKNDPGYVRMDRFRIDLAAVLSAGPTPPKGTTVTPAEIQAVADAVWAKMLGPSTASDCAQKARAAAEKWADSGSLTVKLNTVGSDAQMALANIADLRGVVDQIKAKVDTL